jgi:hypothetical protein
MMTLYFLTAVVATYRLSASMLYARMHVALLELQYNHTTTE